MAVALVYQSPAAACGLGVTAGILYGVHRFLIAESSNSLLPSAKKRSEPFKEAWRTCSRLERNAQLWNGAIFLGANCLSSALCSGKPSAGGLFPPGRAHSHRSGSCADFLCVVIAVQLRHGDVRQLLSLLIFYFVLSRRLLPLISQISFMAGQMETSYKNVELIAHELKECSLWTAVTPRTQKMKGSFVADLQHVSFAFHEGSPLLRNISLCLCQGERVLLCGASGSGKSSLLNIMAGILQPTAGSICVDRMRIAYVPQDVALLMIRYATICCSD